MNFSELIRNRHSIRSYKSDPVEEEKIRTVLKAGIAAPSACNIQPLVFITVCGSENVKSLGRAYSREWLLDAPAVIVVCCDTDIAWKRRDGKSFGDIDAAIAMDHMVLQACDLGLSTCWIGAFDSKELKKALKIEDGIEPVVMTPLGYAAEPPAAKPRKAFEEMVVWKK